MPTPKTLSELVPAYPADHPQDLLALMGADPDTLKDPLAWALRAQVVEATRAHERHHIHTPTDAMQLIVKGYGLHPWEGAWVSYALSPDRQLLLVQGEKGLRPQRVATRLLPKVSDLPALPRRQGSKKCTWLVIYGGTPDVLSKDHVPEGLKSLQERTEVADILFYSRPENGAPTMWSLRAGAGVNAAGGANGDRIAFPDDEMLARARKS